MTITNVPCVRNTGEIFSFRKTTPMPYYHMHKSCESCSGTVLASCTKASRFTRAKNSYTHGGSLTLTAGTQLVVSGSQWEREIGDSYVSPSSSAELGMNTFLFLTF